MLVYHNPSSDVLHPSGIMLAEPGVIAQHPGWSGKYSAVRWQAPQAGTYQINAGFFGISELDQQTTTDVHILVNNTSVFDGLVEGHWANENVRIGTNNAMSLTLANNDYIDFVVGFGSNGNYFNDSTRLDANITKAAEPATWGILLAGLGLIGFITRRRTGD